MYTNGSDLAEYFMYGGKTFLNVNATAGSVEVHPYNFNRTSGYDGTFSFNPKQQAYWSRFDYHKKLDDLIDGLYFSVGTAMAHIENDPGLKETTTKAAAGAGRPEFWVLACNRKLV